MFIGCVPLEETIDSVVVVLTPVNVPVAVDSMTPINVTVYGPGGAMSGPSIVGNKLGADVGVYEYSVPATSANGYAAGVGYRVVITFTVASVVYAQAQTFLVV